MFPYGSNNILVVGGKIYGGECNYVHQIDLCTGTILNRAPLANARVLSKAAVIHGQKFLVIGGNKENEPTCEELDLRTMKWKTVNVQHIRTITNWKCMGYSSYATEVKFSQELADKPPPAVNPNKNYANVSVIFGTDDEPFIIEIDQTSLQFDIKACPLKLKLKNYQGVFFF